MTTWVTELMQTVSAELGCDGLREAPVVVRSDIMASYTIEDVKIEGSYPVAKLLELSMNVGVNQHGVLTYGGLITMRTTPGALRHPLPRKGAAVNGRQIFSLKRAALNN